jgi:hypothetical protein
MSVTYIRHVIIDPDAHTVKDDEGVWPAQITAGNVTWTNEIPNSNGPKNYNYARDTATLTLAGAGIPYQCVKASPKPF